MTLKRVLNTVMTLSAGGYLSQMAAAESATNASAGRMARSMGQMHGATLLMGGAVVAATTAVVDFAAKAERATVMTNMAQNMKKNALSLADTTAQVDALSRSLGVAPDAAAEMLTVIRNMGIASQESQMQLTKASYQLSLFGVDQTEAAQAVYRLALATKSQSESMESATLRSEQYASAIRVAGRESSAQLPGVLAIVQRFDAIGAISNTSAAEVIALSATIADLNKTNIRLPLQTALSVVAKDVPRNIDGIASFLGMSAKSVNSLRQEHPVELMMAIADQLERTVPKDRQIDVLQRLGFTKQEDVFFALLGAGVGEFGNRLADVNEQLAITNPDATELNTQFNDLKKTLTGPSGLFEQMVAGFKRVAVSMGFVLLPIAKTLTEVFAGLADSIAGLSPGHALLAAGMLQVTNPGGAAQLGHLASRGVGFIARRGKSAADGTDAELEGLITNEMRAKLTLMHTKLANMKEAELDSVAEANQAYLGAQTETLARRIELRGPVVIEEAAGKGFLTRLSESLIGSVALAPGRMIGAGIERGAMAVGLEATIPFIGPIIAAMQLLAPVFEHLGNLFQDLAKQGGIMGFIFQTLALTFKGIALVGKGLNWIFDSLWNVIKALWDGILDIPIIGDILKGIGQGASDLAGATSDALSGGLSNLDHPLFEKSAPATAPKKTTNITYNVNVSQGADGGSATTASLVRYGNRAGFAAGG